MEKFDWSGLRYVPTPEPKPCGIVYMTGGFPKENQSPIITRKGNNSGHVKPIHIYYTIKWDSSARIERLG